MKIKSDVHAGTTYTECDAQRNYWKKMAQSGKCNAYYPPTYYPPTYYPPTYPPTTYPPTSRIVAMSFCEPRSCRLQLSS